jgi:phytoene dehydrogenase-like protein
MSISYDLIIVGGGIAGLRVGIETLKLHPHIKCCILEKYAYIGGRIVTFRKNIPKVGEVQWENGAGRISTLHNKVIKLLKEYKLTFVPIPSETDFIDDPIRYDKEPHIVGNKFTDLINVYLEPIQKLPAETLQNHTLKELLDKTIGYSRATQFYEKFPYYSEIHTLRADLALESFRKEMRSNEGFGVVGEGFSALTDGMMNEFISRGGKIIMDTDVYRVTNNLDRSITLDYRVRNTMRKGSHTGRIVVLALHHTAVTKIDGVNNIPVLRHLRMMPLLRIYAVFPTRKNVSWFSGLNKIVTNSPIRYIIPVDAKRGIVMISYTDGMDAKWWFKQDESAAEHGEENVKDLVMTEIRKLFPERAIPDPIFFKQHPWYDGCTYWLPGSYNVVEESNKSLHPKPIAMPNLFMCGESFAVKQCWVESALDQADKLLANHKFRIALRNT